MLHIIKLAVGIRDINHLAEVQKLRSECDAPLRHKTRNTPKRADEITAGGSIYWVINRAVQTRQRIMAIMGDHWDDGSACAGLVLDPQLIPVVARLTKPFQGWRYLTHADAPADIATVQSHGIDELPDQMRLALSQLALLYINHLTAAVALATPHRN